MWALQMRALPSRSIRIIGEAASSRQTILPAGISIKLKIPWRSPPRQ
jgi:hypothetical protein